MMANKLDAVSTTDDIPEYEWGIEDAIAAAESAGFTIVRSTETTLLLDLDDGASQDTYFRTMRSIASLFQLKELDRWASKSGRGIHVVVSCKPLAVSDRVALQACLGSDKIRESLAIAMIQDKVENPIVLFRPKL